MTCPDLIASVRKRCCCFVLCPAVILARQPHLLDGQGDINSQLLERSSNPLVFNSLVLKTALGSYIQVCMA
jgi:hypothetical protein